MTQQHDDVPFRSYEAEYAGPPGTPQWTTDRTGFRVDADCPGCGVTTKRTVRRGLPSGNKGVVRRDRPEEPPMPERVSMICGCGYEHANRPPDSPENGCGAFWKVPLA